MLEEPFCRRCLRRGRRVQTDVVDHIVPWEWSKCDERWNKQGLCHPCHDAKSKRERAEGRPDDIEQRLAQLKARWLGSSA